MQMTTEGRLRNVDLKAIARKAMKKYGFETKFPPDLLFWLIYSPARSSTKKRFLMKLFGLHGVN